ncbi:MAG: Endoribonuclease, partial [Gaiellaceae bacterium]|nr:Endoribonuclease [Gaiellaceae bacterium]
MERRLIPGHSPLEPVVGYSRAVVAGGHVYVAGTAPIPREGEPPAGAYEQARLCLEIVGRALAEAGAAFQDVVRTRVYLTEAADWEDVGRAHGEVFGEIRPASAMLVVK